MRTVIAVAMSLLLLACAREESAADKGVANFAEAFRALGQAAAEGQAGRQGAESGAPENLGEAFAALGAMAQAGQKQLGPVVNWRQLVPFIPEQLAGFTARGELDGATTSMGPMKVSRVERDYKSGDRRLEVRIIDTSLAPAMRGPFAMIGMVQEDSSRGFTKGAKLGGHQAIFEWRQRNQRSRAMVLVGDRFLVEVEVQPARSELEAKDIAVQLDLAKLAQLKAETP